MSNDIVELQQLVVRERLARDRGRWEQLETSWIPSGRIRVSWFDGAAAEFIERSRAMWTAGTRAGHRLAPPVVHVRSDRAVIEVPALIEMRGEVGGAEVDVVSRVRLLYRAERFRGAWSLSDLVCIYQSDAALPVVPGGLPVRSSVRAGRESYRWLGEMLQAQGHPVADDLPGDDEPSTVDEVEHAAFEWLAKA